MGAGVAKEFRDTFKDIDLKLGMNIIKEGNKCFRIIKHNNTDIVSFPTKNDWRDPSCIIRIKLSCIELMELADLNGWTNIALPKPGCTNGGLNWKDVEKEISKYLDNRVTIISL